MKPQLPYPCLTLITRLGGPGNSGPASATEISGSDGPGPADVESTKMLMQRVREGIAGGVNVVQLREKGLPAGDLFALALQLRRVTQGRALFIVNDRVDVALAVGADGAHLPENGLPVESAREMLGEDMLLGCSVHSVAGAAQCAVLGADFVQVGTLYATDSKPGRTPAGPELVREVVTAAAVPVIGVGGITARNAAEVMAAGAHGVAVIGALLDAPDTPAAARRLIQAMHKHPQAQTL